MRQDLIATLQAIALQQTSPQAEWDKSHEIARSAACDKVFMDLAPANGPSVLQEKSLVNSPLKGLAFSVKVFCLHCSRRICFGLVLLALA